VTKQTPKQKNKESQIANLRKAARELGCDESEERFQQILRTVAKKAKTKITQSTERVDVTSYDCEVVHPETDRRLPICSANSLGSCSWLALSNQ
jgi:hypothetical protein